MKKKEWINGNKMLFESGHKTFDRQTNIISTGNIIANTEYGGYIRAYNNIINPVGEKCAPGHLQDFDLKPFKKSLCLPRYVEYSVKQYAKTKSVILYCFFHYNKGRRIIDGFVVTDDDHDYISDWCINNLGISIIKEAIKYVCN